MKLSYLTIKIVILLSKMFRLFRKHFRYRFKLIPSDKCLLKLTTHSVSHNICQTREQISLLIARIWCLQRHRLQFDQITVMALNLFIHS